MPDRVERNKELAFALGNLVPATALGAAIVALPVRFWPTDVLLGGAVLTVAVTSSLVFGRPALTRRALTLAARVLLGVGVVLVTAALLSLAFLAGIHGDFGRGGATLMLLVSLLVLPYAVVYPLVELWWLAARPPAAAVVVRGPEGPASDESPA